MTFILYRSLNNNPIITRIEKLMRDYNESLYEETLSLLLEESYDKDLGSSLFQMYLTYLIAADENAFSLSVERDKEKVDPALGDIVLSDLNHLQELWNCTFFDIQLEEKASCKYLMPIYKVLQEGGNATDLRSHLVQYYSTYGAGMMNRYKAFKWDPQKGLIGIRHCDPVVLSDLVACDYQKKALIQNTESFLAGKTANNALLFGDRGTGKSSSVKAILNEYAPKGLRVLELSKAEFIYFNAILKVLRPRGMKFIIFLDDLSFEEFEVEYKYMKALIEGGVEVRPDNVLIYATSNRRHLIKETWSEREGGDVNVSDARQEKLSLADRFGLSLTFTSPNQNTYLEMVMKIAAKEGIQLSEQVLREKALQWELLHGGRSGRVAKQFIQSLT